MNAMDNTPRNKPAIDTNRCLVELRNIRKAFGGVLAVDDVSLNL